MQLLHDSWIIFKELKLEDWVNYVMGMPSVAIGLFESYHNQMGLSLYSLLQQSPCVVEVFGEVTKIVKQIDRFLYFTLSHALMEFENKHPYHNLPMEAGVIAGPLKVLLDRPDRYIIQRLKVLEARYNHYKIGPDIARGRAFDVRTDFFTAVTDQSAATMAWKMTQDVLREFANLNINEIMLNGDHLRRLALKWDQLYHDTLEVATAGGLDGKLRDIAKELYTTRNHFSLCAILNGMEQAQLQVESNLAGFTNAKDNHHQYRLQLHADPSLPFIYPFIVELRRGQHEVLKKIFSFLLYKQFIRGSEEATIANEE
ncbi:unnamed protein product [Penicillium nalgiovense]|nr:unnamed protein product [Penicillium nalgiovense]CAG7976097.1 unnamed protein product [Penicillium nalgiovense]CAG8009652.1 unnamed protein product [Penicillium nalgiovense]CAG8016265.1 unnamed protein product [Penicillium nalgiovense]CAG8022924.1 unnamed protein product [Penicillium nalgiovense]